MYIHVINHHYLNRKDWYNFTITYEIDIGEIEIVNEAIDKIYNFFLFSQFFGSSVENVIDFSLSLVGIFDALLIVIYLK